MAFQLVDIRYMMLCIHGKIKNYLNNEMKRGSGGLLRLNDKSDKHLPQRRRIRRQRSLPDTISESIIRITRSHDGFPLLAGCPQETL
ncbi:Protein of unknown function [Cotesia congregata]|uniref:Uncharacterized protein n=1 Tax=Cotesia congregata TaxID=51543 RepID=A0A8J2H8U6_COTCN|nr:Protein of unknown function [Cotesia congregata]